MQHEIVSVSVPYRRSLQGGHRRRRLADPEDVNRCAVFFREGGRGGERQDEAGFKK